MEEANGYDEGLYERFFAIVGPADEGKPYSQKKAASMLGVSQTAVSAYKSKTYNASVKDIEARIRSWLERVDRRLSELEVPTVETGAMGAIVRAIEMAHDDKEIAVVVGEAGVGKTTACRKYADEARNAIFVEVDPSWTTYVLVEEIARLAGVNPRGNMSAKVGRIVESLKASDRVVIIDEAEYLSDGSLELIRRVINDKAQTGVVLVGLPRLEYKLLLRRNDHDQLLTRVGAFYNAGRLKKDDGEKIIRAVWPTLPREVVVKFLESAGSARTLVKLMCRVNNIMGLNAKEAPDSECVTEAKGYLMASGSAA